MGIKNQVSIDGNLWSAKTSFSGFPGGVTLLHLTNRSEPTIRRRHDFPLPRLRGQRPEANDSGEISPSSEPWFSSTVSVISNRSHPTLPKYLPTDFHPQDCEGGHGRILGLP